MPRNMLSSVVAATLCTVALFGGIYLAVAMWNYPPWGEPIERSRFRDMTSMVGFFCLYVAPIAAAVGGMAVGIRATLLQSYSRAGAVMIAVAAVTASTLVGAEVVYRLGYDDATIFRNGEWIQLAFLAAVPTAAAILFFRRFVAPVPKRSAVA